MESLWLARLTANVSNSGCRAAKCGPFTFQWATLIWLCRSRPSASRALSDCARRFRASSFRALELRYIVTSFIARPIFHRPPTLSLPHVGGGERCRRAWLRVSSTPLRFQPHGGGVDDRGDPDRVVDVLLGEPALHDDLLV